MHVKPTNTGLYIYWLIVVTSILVTIAAWQITNKQVQQKNNQKFEYQAEQLLALITEQMLRYEVALKGGVAANQLIHRKINAIEWELFSSTLNIEKMYPGINGIGVIYYVSADNLVDFTEEQRLHRPEFTIHPQHNKAGYWPITYVGPVSANAKAIGLDMAFEHKRLTAAKKSRDTGTTQITAPIVLVQDDQKTPGFLQFVPFYKKQNLQTMAERQQHFVGHVYAPFIMSKLMSGTLSQRDRQVVFSVFDGDENLYNELVPDNVNYEVEPLFKKTVTVDIYGRAWRFNIQTSKAFRENSDLQQPLIILVCGIVITGLLFFLWVTLSRQRKAVLLAVDISEKLSNKEEYYRHIIEAAPCSIIIINEQGVIEKVNLQTELLFGYANNELLGQSIDLLVPERFRIQHPKHRQHFSENPSQRKMGQGRAIFGLTKEGREFPAEIGLARFSGEGGFKTLATVMNMTEYMKITQELKRSNNELNEFAYIASHDLKAPLRGIIQISSWIEEDITEHAQEETINYLKLLKKRTFRLEQILDDLLAYSRIGSQSEEKQMVNTKLLFESTFELLDPPAGLRLIIQECMPMIETFATPLETIVRNLLANAIKHHDKVDGIISITVKEMPVYYEFSVIDDGPGIEPEYHQQIFDLFKTLNPRDQIEGSGMGLSIIKKILDVQGGSITIMSDGKSGTCFTFLWPK
mgnify:CR=1 FL=1